MSLEYTLLGGISRTITAPMDRLKISLQVMPYSQRVKTKHLLKNIIRKEGYKALFYGNGVNCLKVIPESALKFTLYDWIKRQIIKYRHSNQEAFSNVHYSLETENAIPLSPSEKFLAGGIAGYVTFLHLYCLKAFGTQRISANCCLSSRFNKNSFSSRQE
jgi:solute carrier family 25 (mitochondrial phosphate transporter), member 23/24/25/41